MLYTPPAELNISFLLPTWSQVSDTRVLDFITVLVEEKEPHYLTSVQPAYCFQKQICLHYNLMWLTITENQIRLILIEGVFDSQGVVECHWHYADYLCESLYSHCSLLVLHQCTLFLIKPLLSIHFVSESLSYSFFPQLCHWVYHNSANHTKGSIYNRYAKNTTVGRKASHICVVWKV